MRILCSAVPAHGHVLPMMPMARAAISAGHNVALLTHGALRDVADPVPVLAAGPSMDELSAAHSARTLAPHTAMRTPEQVAEFFVTTRLPATLGPALNAAAAYRPDLLIADAADEAGPLVAGALGVPWAQHSLGMAIAEDFTTATAAAVARFCDIHGLCRSRRVAYLDICPTELQPENWEPPLDRIAVRPEPFDRGTEWAPSPFDEPGRPTVLVTFGTMLDDAALLGETLQGLAGVGVNVLVTSMPGRPAPRPSRSEGWIHDIGFVPLARVLPHLDAVVCVGGMGTMLAVLANGLPFVGIPRFPSQQWITRRAAELGAGIVVERAEAIPEALLALLSDSGRRDSAAAASAIVADMPDPTQALSTLLELISS